MGKRPHKTVAQRVADAKSKYERNKEQPTVEDVVLAIGQTPDNAPEWALEYCAVYYAEKHTITDPRNTDYFLDLIIREFFLDAGDTPYAALPNYVDVDGREQEVKDGYKSISFKEAYRRAKKRNPDREQPERSMEKKWQKERAEKVAKEPKNSLFRRIGLPETPRTLRVFYELQAEYLGQYPRVGARSKIKTRALRQVVSRKLSSSKRT